MIYVVTGYSPYTKTIGDFGYFGSEKDAKEAMEIHYIEEFKHTFIIRTI